MIKSSIRTGPRRNEEPFRDSFHQATVVSFLSHKRAWTNITGEVLWLSQTRRNNGVYCHHHWLTTLLWPGLSLSWRLSNNHAWKYLELMCAHWDRKQERLSVQVKIAGPFCDLKTHISVTPFFGIWHFCDPIFWHLAFFVTPHFGTRNVWPFAIVWPPSVGPAFVSKHHYVTSCNSVTPSVGLKI